jgi:hypothetical protein
VYGNAHRPNLASNMEGGGRRGGAKSTEGIKSQVKELC